MFTITCNLCGLSSEEKVAMETFRNEHKCSKDDVLKKISINIIHSLCPNLLTNSSDCRCNVCSCIDGRELFDDVKCAIRDSKLWEIAEKNLNTQAD